MAAGALLAFTPLCRVQIGIRFMLPLVALAVVGLAAGIVQAAGKAGPVWRQRLWSGGGVLAVAWTLWSGLGVWPHGLCYANELWGGSRNAYVKISETNYDWGQGLKELVRWQRTHGVNDLDVWYFGTEYRDRHHARASRRSKARRAWQRNTVAPARGHYLAVGTTLLYGSFNDTDASRAAAAYLRGCTPLARTQTFLIYDLRASK